MSKEISKAGLFHTKKVYNSELEKTERLEHFVGAFKGHARRLRALWNKKFV